MFLVEAGLYESKEEDAKREQVLGRMRQARIFLKKIISNFKPRDGHVVIFLRSVGLFFIL